MSPPIKSQACDTCKARKVRCERSSSTSDAPCDGCLKHGFSCTLKHEAKKRGPLKDAPRMRSIAPKEAQIGPSTTIREEVLDNPLETLLPRPLLTHAISTYFKYLYGLVPVVHRPTFLADFAAKREERPGEEEWTTMVLCIVAATLAQVPWAFEMDKKQVRILVQACWDRARNWVFGDFKEFTVGRSVVLYLSLDGYAESATVYTTRLGHMGNRELCLGANWSCMYRNRLHDESTYASMNPIEAQIRRRLFWLTLGFDKSAQAVHGIPPLHTSEHCSTVQLPEAIDDEYLTLEGYSIPNSETSLLAGFRYVSRLYGLFGHILDMRRLDRLKAPTGVNLHIRLSEVDEVYDQMMNLMSSCPEELRFVQHDDIPPLEWADSAFHNVQALFDRSKPSNVADGFLVQQANIYSTQQMARQFTVRYRAELHNLRRAEIHDQLLRTGLTTLSSRNAEEDLEKERDRTAEDMLRLLKSIPIQVLAVNGDAVVNKVRYVAVTQLDALEMLANASSERDAERLKTAQNYLYNFLTILGDIEGLFSIQDV